MSYKNNRYKLGSPEIKRLKSQKNYYYNDELPENIWLRFSSDFLSPFSEARYTWFPLPRFLEGWSCVLVYNCCYLTGTRDKCNPRQHNHSG